MKKHINADFFKLLIAFLIICASFNPGLSDAAPHHSSDLINIKYISDINKKTISRLVYTEENLLLNVSNHISY